MESTPESRALEESIRKLQDSDADPAERKLRDDAHRDALHARQNEQRQPAAQPITSVAINAPNTATLRGGALAITIPPPVAVAPVAVPVPTPLRVMALQKQDDDTFLVVQVEIASATVVDP